MEVGAVAAMRYVKDGIKASRLVMQRTKQTMLVVDRASSIAISMDLSGPTNLSSSEPIEKWTRWKEHYCQPNFWKNVLPVDSCGRYQPKDKNETICSEANSMGIIELRTSLVGPPNYDTISMAVFDKILRPKPKLAAKDAISRIARKFPGFMGAVVAINKNGVHAGACHGRTFQHSVRNQDMDDVKIFTALS